MYDASFGINEALRGGMMKNICIGFILLITIALLSHTLGAQSLDQIAWRLTVHTAHTNHISMTLSGYNPNSFTWSFSFPNAVWAVYSIDGDVQIDGLIPPMSITISIPPGATLTEPMDHYGYVEPGYHTLQAHAFTSTGFVPIGSPAIVNVSTLNPYQMNWELIIDNVDTNGNIWMRLAVTNPLSIVWTYAFYNYPWFNFSIDGQTNPIITLPAVNYLTLQPGETQYRSMQYTGTLDPGSYILQALIDHYGSDLLVGNPVIVTVPPVSNEDLITPSLAMTVFPNPFHQSLSIAFSPSKSGLDRISVYNLKGQRIRELDSVRQSDGTLYTIWDGMDLHSNQVSNGIYVIKRIYDGGTEIRRVTLIR